MATLFFIAKVGLFLLLAIFHTLFFGIPSVQQFLEEQVTVVETSEPAGPMQAPAITLCPVANHTRGWKNTSKTNWFENYEEMCSGAQAPHEFVSCIEEKTFSLGDLIPYVPPYGLGATHGVFNGVNNLDEVTNLTGQQFWISEVTAGNQGQCHTLNFTQKIQSLDLQKDSILIVLNPRLQYWISLHQLSFFLMNFNPMTMPFYDSTLQFDENSSPYLHLLILEAVRHEKINREAARCNAAPDYDFSSCVKLNISQEIGCKLPWDNQTTGVKIA